MELVRQFSSEVNSIYDGKLPVSRAKMASITRSAVKAIKHYKHVVMTVEKFISKCGPEYKLPGLYVMDSIVRQSRHQFGTEKDVYGPRFSKNMEKTFKNLFMCTQNDQPKIMRVLNLWQKNQVFPTSLIQKLMALAPNPDATPSSTAPPAPSAIEEVSVAPEREGDGLDLDSASAIIQQQQNQIQALLQQQQQLQLQAQASTLLAPAGNILPTSVQNLLTQQTLAQQQQQQQQPGGLSQVEALASLLQQAHQLQEVQQMAMGGAQAGDGAHVETPEPQPVFNTALLDNDFDYSSEEESGPSLRPMGMGRQREHRRDSIHSPPPFEPPRNSRPSRDPLAPPRPPLPLQGGPTMRDPIHQSPTSALIPPPEPANERDVIIKKLEQQILLHQQKFKQKDSSGGLGDFSSRASQDPIRGAGTGNGLGYQPGALPFESADNHMLGPPPSRRYGAHEEFPPSKDWRPDLEDSHPPAGGVAPHMSIVPPPPSHHTLPGGEPPPPGPPQPGFFPPQAPPRRRETPSPPPPMRKNRFQPLSPPPAAPTEHVRSPSPHQRPSGDFWQEKGHNSVREIPDRDRRDRPERDKDRSDRGRRSDKGDYRRSRHSRSPRRGRTRSRSRSPISRHSSPSRRSPRSFRRSPSYQEEKERKRKGIPGPRTDHVSVCTCTLWVGHLPKNVKQQQIKEAFEDYGQVESVDVVAARGCAYVVMVHRSDATRARQGLKDIRIGGQHGKIAWAPGRGVKGPAFRSYWLLEEGVSYVPWSKVKSQKELASLAEGGWIDPATCPTNLEVPVKGAADDSSLAAAEAAPPPPFPPLPAQPLPPIPTHPGVPQHSSNVPLPPVRATSTAPLPPGQVPQPPSQIHPQAGMGQIPPPAPQQQPMAPPSIHGRPQMNAPPSPAAIPRSYMGGPPAPPHQVHGYSQASMMPRPPGPPHHHPGFGHQQPPHLGRPPRFDPRLARPDFMQNHGPGPMMRPRDFPYQNHRRPPPHMHQFHPAGGPGGQGPPRSLFGPPHDHNMLRQMPPRGSFPMPPNLPPRGYGGPGGLLQYPPDGDRIRFPPPGGMTMPPPGDGERRVSPPGERGIMAFPSEDGVAHPLPPGEIYEPSQVTSPDSEIEEIVAPMSTTNTESNPVSTDNREEAVEEVEMDIKDEDMSLDEEDKEEPSHPPTQELEQVPSGSSQEPAVSVEGGGQDMAIDSQELSLKSQESATRFQESASKSPQELAPRSQELAPSSPQELAPSSPQELAPSPQELIPRSPQEPAPRSPLTEPPRLLESATIYQETAPKSPQESAQESPLISQEPAQKCQLDSSLSAQDDPAPASEPDSLDSSDIDAMLDNIQDGKKFSAESLPADLPSNTLSGVSSLLVTKMAPTSSSPLLTALVAENKTVPDQLPPTTTGGPLLSSIIPRLPSFMANLSPITPENPISSGESTSVFPVTPAVDKLEPDELSTTGDGAAYKVKLITSAKPDSEEISHVPRAADEEGAGEDDVYVSLSGDISGGSLDVDRGSSCNPSLVSEEPSLGDVSLLGRSAEPCCDKVDLEREHDVGSAWSELALAGATGEREGECAGELGQAPVDGFCTIAQAGSQDQVVRENIATVRASDGLCQTGRGACMVDDSTDCSGDKEADVIQATTAKLESAGDCAGGIEMEQEHQDMETVGLAESCDKDLGGAEDCFSVPPGKVETGEEVMDFE